MHTAEIPMASALGHDVNRIGGADVVTACEQLLLAHPER
jgi:hypothetical protein